LTTTRSHGRSPAAAGLSLAEASRTRLHGADAAGERATGCRLCDACYCAVGLGAPTLARLGVVDFGAWYAGELHAWLEVGGANIAMTWHRRLASLHNVA